MRLRASRFLFFRIFFDAALASSVPVPTLRSASISIAFSATLRLIERSLYSPPRTSNSWSRNGRMRLTETYELRSFSSARRMSSTLSPP